MSAYSVVLGALKFIPNTTVYSSRRHVSLCANLCKDNRMPKALQKMLNKEKKHKKWYLTPVTPTRNARPGKRKYSPGMQRRAVQVSHVLYDRVTQIVNSGELHQRLQDLRVDISKVEMVPDMSAVNVSWMTTGSDQDGHVEKILKQNAGKLRQILISNGVLSTIPNINFVRDKTREIQLEVERLLKTADFGPDYRPTSVVDLFKTSPETATVHNSDPNEAYTETLSGTLKAGENFERDCKTETSQTDDSEMLTYKTIIEEGFLRQDLYGLNHDLLMDKVLKAKKKDRTRPKVSEDLEQVVTQIPNSEAMTRRESVERYAKMLQKNKPKKQKGDLSLYELEQEAFRYGSMNREEEMKQTGTVYSSETESVGNRHLKDGVFADKKLLNFGLSDEEIGEWLEDGNISNDGKEMCWLDHEQVYEDGYLLEDLQLCDEEYLSDREPYFSGDELDAGSSSDDSKNLSDEDYESDREPYFSGDEVDSSDSAWFSSDDSR